MSNLHCLKLRGVIDLGHMLSLAVGFRPFTGFHSEGCWVVHACAPWALRKDTMQEPSLLVATGCWGISVTLLSYENDSLFCWVKKRCLWWILVEAVLYLPRASYSVTERLLSHSWSRFPPPCWGCVWQRVSPVFLLSPSGKGKGRPNNQPVRLGGNPILTLWSLPIAVKHQKQFVSHFFSSSTCGSEIMKYMGPASFIYYLLKICVALGDKSMIIERKLKLK